MSESHLTEQTSEKPTFAQLKWLMAEIDRGKVTQESLHWFLAGRFCHTAIKKHETCCSFVDQFGYWHSNWPGKEIELASRLLRFLSGGRPLALKPAAPEKWRVFRRAIHWQTCKRVIFVNKGALCADVLNVDFEISFADSLHSLLTDDIDDRLDRQGSSGATILATEMLLHGGEKNDMWGSMSDMLSVKYAWCEDSSPRTLLKEAFDATIEVAAVFLALDEHIDDTYTLLDMWGSGNYPLGFDKNNNLIVLSG